jgi:hypothetical protein
MTTTPEPATPEVGQQYAHRPGLDPRTVTITRVWAGDDGRVSVAYEWRDNQPGQCGSACPIKVFHRAYEPVTPAEPAPVLSEAERTFLRFALDCAASELSLAAGRTTRAEGIAALDSLRKLAGEEV